MAALEARGSCSEEAADAGPLSPALCLVFHFPPLLSLMGDFVYRWKGRRTGIGKWRNKCCSISIKTGPARYCRVTRSCLATAQEEMLLCVVGGRTLMQCCWKSQIVRRNMYIVKMYHPIYLMRECSPVLMKLRLWLNWIKKKKSWITH